MAYDLFISYASKDKTAADAICTALESRGILCWMAPRNIPHGDWGEAIIDAINASKVMVLVLSSHANQSSHIKREVERAVAKGLTIIPVRIEEVVPERALEYFISSVHWLDAITPPIDAHLGLLADRVHQVLGHETVAAKSPSPLPSPPSPQPPPPPPPPPLPLQPWPKWLAGGLAIAGLVAVLVWVKPGDDGQPGVTTKSLDTIKIQRMVEERLSEHGLSLRVDVGSDGMVLLTGVVKNDKEKRQAEELAKVPGAAGVKIEINVQEQWRK